MTRMHELRERSKGRAGRLWLAAALALALVGALACSKAAEPTPTSAATPSATPAPIAPTAPGAVATATPKPAEPTPTPSPVARPVRRQLATEQIARLPQMTLEEVHTLFPFDILSVDTSGKGVKRGGVLIEAVNYDFSKFDPRLSGAIGTQRWPSMVYERLVSFDTSPEKSHIAYPPVIPSMAKSWEFTKDGKRLTFKLNQGMHWGNIDNPADPGPEITAEDVVWVLNDYKTNSVHSKLYDTVVNFETVDRYTLAINFKEPSFFVLPALGQGATSTMFNPYLARAGTRMNLEIVGPGPFRLKEAKLATHVKFVRNPYHFRKDDASSPLPYLDGWDMFIVPDAATQIAMLRTGKADIISRGGIQKLRELQTWLGPNPEFQVSRGTGLGGTWHVAMNVRNKPWDDVRARRALALALDMEAVSNVVFDGRGFLGDEVFAWWYWRDQMPTFKNVKPGEFGNYIYRYDPEKARQLFKEAGIGKLKLTLPFFQYGEFVPDTLNLFVEDLRKVGIELVPQQQDYAQYNSQLVGGKWDNLIWGWVTHEVEEIQTVYNHFYPGAGGNRWGIDDPELTRLAQEIRVEFDRAKRIQILNQARLRAYDQVWYIPITENALGLSVCCQPWVRNLTSGGLPRGLGYNAADTARFMWLDK